MAIIIANKSRCNICGNLIKTGEPVIGFPHFCNNHDHALYPFSDRGFHESCIVNHSLYEELEIAVKTFEKTGQYLK